MQIVSAEFHRTTGLGNKLFPWARAKILANALGCRVKANKWVAPRGGALLRGGINYGKALAKIWLVGNFRADPTEVGRFEFHRNYRQLPVTFLDRLPGILPSSTEDRHFVFKWDKNHEFSDLRPHRDFIKERLLAVASPGQADYLAMFANRDFIALNIRTGKDFKRKSSQEIGYYLTEIDWFVEALEKVRKIHGDLPAFVVSDGGPRQLGAVLKAHNVSLVETRTAIADLLILLQAKVLLGSGNSSFSAWAAFLGGMDTYSSIETPFDHFSIAGPGSSQIVGIL